MAKLDTYTLRLTIGSSQDKAELALTVIFEDGDNSEKVIEQVRADILKEAIKMKKEQFIIQVRQ